MSQVKGSKQVQMKVVPDRPRVELAIRAALVCGFLLVAVGCFYLGFARGVNINGDARLERSDLLNLAKTQQETIDALESQLLFSEQANILDRQSLEQVQATLVRQRQTITSLEQDLSLYRQVMSPETESGFSIGSTGVTPLTELPNSFNLRVELLQKGDQEEVSGDLGISISGTLDGEWTSLALTELGAQTVTLPFSFRYFQNVESIITLPPGFLPESISLKVDIDGIDQPVVASVDWNLQP